MEVYNLKYLPPYLRSCLAQFRAGILPIEIELGRYRNVPAEQRLCPLCTLGEPEDECHFVFRCEHFANLRTIMFNNTNIDTLDEVQALRTLMESYAKKLSIYICNALQKRKHTLYQ